MIFTEMRTVRWMSCKTKIHDKIGDTGTRVVTGWLKRRSGFGDLCDHGILIRLKGKSYSSKISHAL